MEYVISNLALFVISAAFLHLKSFKIFFKLDHFDAKTILIFYTRN